MAKFASELHKRLKKDADTIVQQSAEALTKLLQRERDLQLTDREYAQIQSVAEHRFKLSAEQMLQAFDMIVSTRTHRQESIELREDVLEATAAKLTYLRAFDEGYLVADSQFSSQYLSRVDENAFKAGLEEQGRERLLELHRWLKEVIGG